MYPEGSALAPPCVVLGVLPFLMLPSPAEPGEGAGADAAAMVQPGQTLSLISS